MVQTNPYAQYKEQSISTLAPGEVVVKLFEEAMKQVLRAGMMIDERNTKEAHDAIIKAEQVFFVLMGALDMKYPISSEISRLYKFISDQLVKANMTKDKEILNSILPLIKDFRDTFREADRLSRIK